MGIPPQVPRTDTPQRYRLSRVQQVLLVLTGLSIKAGVIVAAVLYMYG